MTRPNDAFIWNLVHTWPELDDVVRYNLEEAGGVLLPHLVLSDVMRWLVDHLHDDREECEALLAWIGHQYDAASDEVKDLIAVSGVEMLPDPDEPGGAELRAMLPPNLRGLDPWLI